MPNHLTQPTIQDLRFNVSQLLKETTGAKRRYQIDSATVNLSDDDVKLVDPLSGVIEFLRTGQDILVTGTLHTTIEKPCGRCLTPFQTSAMVDLEEIFYPTVDLTSGRVMETPVDADEANRIDELHTLDLHEVVRQAVLLEAEGARYCKSTCKGLCPYCGQDRNLTPCTCAENQVDVRWAGLLSLESEE